MLRGRLWPYRRSNILSLAQVAWLFFFLVPLLGLMAADQPIGATSSQPVETLISLNFPENVELKVLVDYVSQRLGLNILYDEQLQGKRVTIKSPSKISKDALLSILNSALRTKGLAMIDAEIPGWKRIVATSGMTSNTAIATSQPDWDAQTTNSPITQVFALRYIDPQRLEQVIKPFLTPSTSSSMPIAEQRLLIITDHSANLQRLNDLIQLMDQPRRDSQMEFVPIQYVEVSQLMQQLAQLLRGRGGGSAGQQDALEIAQDSRSNQLILIGSKERIAEAKGVIRSLDVSLDVETKVYQFKAVAADRMERLVKELVGPVESKRGLRSTVDRDANLLVLTASTTVHQRVEQLRQSMDNLTSEEQSPIRFYKLTNATATEVLSTIRSLDGGEGLKAAILDEDGGSHAPTLGTGGTSKEPAQPATNGTGDSSSDKTANTPNLLAPAPINPAGSLFGSGPSSDKPVDLKANSIKTKRATVTADTNTNTIIVVAEPAIQAVYERLIRTLDKRRPQVLLECTIVTLDTSKGFSLGVEISKSGAFNSSKTLSFSSFGLSEVDKSTGALTLTPGTGFNGAIIGSDIANVVIRALATSGRAKVSSAPKILVNDNATGTLASISEAPYTSVNASSTVATTSFAGYVSAGTTITLTPHISAGDYLALEYAVALNSFTGQGSSGVPPPRQSNTVQSKVTIPDGSTVIVGGLNRRDISETKSSIPILGDIPILEYLMGKREESDKESSLFIFIRPVILRDDRFEDLKYLTERDRHTAEIASDWLASVPMEMP